MKEESRISIFFRNENKIHVRSSKVKKINYQLLLINIDESNSQMKLRQSYTKITQIKLNILAKKKKNSQQTRRMNMIELR